MLTEELTHELKNHQVLLSVSQFPHTYQTD